MDETSIETLIIHGKYAWLKSILKPSPLGTVGVIAPWNFPVGMIFYPAASIFAAGNRIMAKPSELTPNTADVIKEAVEKYFDVSEFSVVLGGPEVGAEFSFLTFRPFTLYRKWKN